MTNSAASTEAKTPIKVRKLGHLVYEVSDVERSTRFWTDVMGFEVSDVNELGMVFLRYGGDHHSIALVPAKKGSRPPDEAGLQFHHLAMEVGSVEELFAARDFLHAKGIEICYEGRRGPGGNAGVEFRDPDGYMFEIYANMDQTPEDGRSRPSVQWRRAPTLEDAVANPLPERW